MSNKIRIVLIALLLCVPLGGAVAWVLEGDAIQKQAGELIMDRNFKDAASLLAADPGTGEQAAARRFLRGHALLLSGDAPAAIEVFESYVKEFENGTDVERARHGIAAAKRLRKDFASAATMGRDALNRLLSPARRLELAKVYLDYATKAAKGVEPNLKRSRTFLDLAASLELPRADDERVGIEAATISQKLSEFGDALLRMQNIKKKHGAGPGGMHNFKIAELQRLTGDALGARRTFRDYIRENSNAEKVPDAMYGIGQTYGMPQPADADSYSRGVAAMEELIKKFPAHALARSAALDVAVASNHTGRLDDAIAQFQGFVSSAPAGDRDPRIASARALIGRCFAAQGKFTEAIAAWKLYLTEHPSHGDFAQVNHWIVDAEFDMASKAARDALVSAASARELGDAARAAIQAFLGAHPLDARHAAAALKLAEIEEARERFDVAREEYGKIYTKYAGTAEASLAQFEVGRIYEERTSDYEKAIEAYKKVTGAHADRAAQRIAQLQKKSLTVRTPRPWRTDEDPAIEVTSRNIEKLRIRAFKLDLDVFFRAKLARPQIESLDVEVIEPDLRRDVPTDPYAPHKETTRPVVLSEFKGKQGSYVIKVDDGEFEATTLVFVSDLVFVAKGMRDGVLIFAQNARTGEGIPNARMIVSDGQKVLLEDRTGADGVLFKRNAWKDAAAQLVIYGSCADGMAVTGLNLASVETTEALKPRTLVVSDRSSYQPGEDVRAFTIVRNVKNGSYSIDAGSAVSLELADPAGTVLRSVASTLSNVGTAQATLALPPNATFGNWTILVTDANGRKVLGSRQVAVEETRLDRVKLQIELERAVCMRGEPLKGTLRAKYFSGGPLQKRAVTVRFPRSEPLALQTDDAGAALFTFETRDLSEEGVYAVMASIDEDAVFATAQATIATVEFRPSVTVRRPVVLSEEAFDVDIATRDAAGAAVEAGLSLEILKRERGGLRRVDTKNVSTAKATGMGSARISIKEGGSYLLRATGRDRFGSVVNGEASIVVSGEDDTQKIRVFVEREQWRLGETVKARVVSRLAGPCSTLATFEGAGVLEYKLTKIPRGESSIEFEARESFAPEVTFSLAGIEQWKLYTAAQPLRISKALRVELKAPAAPLAPGDEVNIEAIVKDARGNPAPAELWLTAVDSAFLMKRPDNNAPLETSFYAGNRTAGTVVSSSCGFSYLAQTRGIARDLAREELLARQSLDAVRKPGAPTGGGPGQAAADAEHRELSDLSDSLSSLGYVGGEPGSPPGSVAGLRKEGGKPAGQPAGSLRGGAGGFSGRASRSKSADRQEVDKKSDGRGPATPQAAGPATPGPTHKLKESADQVGSYRGLAAEQGPGDMNESDWGAEGGPEALVRGVMASTGFVGLVVADGTGTGRIQFKVPANPTEWSLKVRGVTAQTELGEGSGSFVSRKPVEISSRLPQAFHEGDTTKSSFLIRNNSESKVLVQPVWTIQNQNQESDAAIELAAGGEYVASRPVVVGKDESLKMRLQATAGSVSDALEQVIPIRPEGFPVYDVKSAVFQNEAILDLTLESFQKLKNVGLDILIAPSLQADLLEERIVHWRGCIPPEFIQDTTGFAITRGEVALARLRYLAAVGKSGDVTVEVQRRAVADAIARVIAEQDDAGFLNWAGNRSDILQERRPVKPDTATTARSLGFLGAAKRQGFVVPEERIQALIGAMQNALRGDAPPMIRARILLALALAGAPNDEFAQRLHRAKSDLPDTGLGLLARAHIQMERPELAEEVLETLLKRAGGAGQGLPFGKDPTHGSDALEATGLALQVLVRLQPTHGLVQRCAESLRAARTRMVSDRGEAAALVALLAFHGGTATSATSLHGAQYELAVELNGAPLHSISSKTGQSFQTFRVDSAKVLEKNRVKLTLSGRGEIAVTAVMSGFRPESAHTEAGFVRIGRNVEPSHLTFRGKSIPRGFSVIEGAYSAITYDVRSLAIGSEVEVTVSFSARDKESMALDYMLLEEPIPAGCELVPNSATGTFDRLTVRGGALIAAFEPQLRSGFLRYRIIAVRPGQYTHGSSRASSLYNMEKRAGSVSRKLEVLDPHVKSRDEFKLTPDELYYLGVAQFDGGEHEAGAAHLRTLLKNHSVRAEYLRESAQRILSDALERNDAPVAIAAFEQLRDRFGDVSLPFSTVVRVGEAYLAANQAEIADMTFRGTMGALYRREANVAGNLLAEGEVTAAMRFLQDLQHIYPDITETLTSIHELAGLATMLAANPPKEGGIQLRREALMQKAAEIEREFLVRAPTSSLAPEAMFGYLSACLETGLNWDVISGCTDFARRYPESALVDEVLYMEGYARFADGDPRKAIEILNRVVDETFADGTGARVSSQYKSRAVLLRAQIHHATGNVKAAVAEYEKVVQEFTDASDAVRSFRSRDMTLPPVKIIGMKDKAEFAVQSKNLATASMRVYRVDLMRLYLMERNLDRMTSIDLSGIRPILEKQIALGTSEDFESKETAIDLGLAEKGAYLIVLRTENEVGAESLAGATLLLRTDIKVEVREDAVAGRTWINVRNSANASIPKAEVRVVGSQDGEVKTGRTDLRGVYIAEGIHGRTTVIAQVMPADPGDNSGPSFAFFKGSVELAPQPRKAKAAEKGSESFEDAATKDVLYKNRENQLLNSRALESKLRSVQSGVELQRVK